MCAEKNSLVANQITVICTYRYEHMQTKKMMKYW